MKRILMAMIVVGLLAAAGFHADAAPQQMKITLAGYTNRTEILTNFPVLVVLSNNVGGASSFDFSNFVTTNGTDLRFVTNLTDASSLNYEIESWNTNAGQASCVWVQVPLIPSNALFQYMTLWSFPITNVGMGEPSITLCNLCSLSLSFSSAFLRSVMSVKMAMLPTY